jgi:tight adherence protein B
LFGKQVLLDYDVYVMSKKEWLFYFSLGAVFLFFVAYVFYQSIVLSALVAPLAFFYPPLKTKEIIAQRKKELGLQFKEALYALSSSLMAGRSLESAFKEALKDLSLLYPNPQIYIIQEFTYISRRLDMNVTIEDALADFAQRAHLEDIDSFVDVLLISKRSGGNIVEIIKNTSTIIGDKLQIKQEIDTLLAEKKFEQKILNVMPIAMLLLLTWSTGDYMGPVFTTFFGKLMMTIAVLLLGLAYYLSKKIMTIEV